MAPVKLSYAVGEEKLDDNVPIFGGVCQLSEKSDGHLMFLN
ncbi:MAG: hypothetical protein OXE99_08635 [Cellvibrionales bacterium]|nr:hypothetical protein [Cellvibrionales bacterium]